MVLGVSIPTEEGDGDLEEGAVGMMRRGMTPRRHIQERSRPLRLSSRVGALGFGLVLLQELRQATWQDGIHATGRGSTDMERVGEKAVAGHLDRAGAADDLRARAAPVQPPVMKPQDMGRQAVVERGARALKPNVKKGNRGIL